MFIKTEEIISCDYSCPLEFSDKELSKLEVEGKLKRLNSKYGILSKDDRFENGKGFNRIISLKDTKNSKKGLVGGYIDKGTYLDLDGDWWIEYSALVCNSIIKGNAYIGELCIVEYSKITDNVLIGNCSLVLFSKVTDSAEINDECKVYSSDICGSTRIINCCEINKTTINDNTKADKKLSINNQNSWQCNISNFVNITESKILNSVNIDNNVNIVKCNIKGNNINISDYTKLIETNIYNHNMSIKGVDNREDNTILVDCRVYNRQILNTTGLLYNKEL